jgi:hypothetical protein
MSGDKTKAKTAYQDFLTLWKDADSEIPDGIDSYGISPEGSAPARLDSQQCECSSLVVATEGGHGKLRRRRMWGKALSLADSWCWVGLAGGSACPTVRMFIPCCGHGRGMENSVEDECGASPPPSSN